MNTLKCSQTQGKHEKDEGSRLEEGGFEIGSSLLVFEQLSFVKDPLKR